MRITGRTRFGVAVILSAAIAGGCAGGAALTASPSAIPSPSAAASPARTPYCGHAQMSIDYGDYVLAGIQVEGPLHDLFATKDDAAVGAWSVVARVVAKRPAAWNTRDGGIPEALLPGPNHGYLQNGTILTPYDVEVEEVVRGGMAVGPGQVAVEGGTVDCYELRVDPVPEVRVGSEYLLFLRGTAYADGTLDFPLKRVFEAWPTNGETVGTPAGSKKLADVLATIRALPQPSLSPGATPTR